MLKLHYTGPETMINQYGIFLKQAKNDDYIYLPAAITILKSIHKNETKHISVDYNITDTEMLKIIKTSEPQLEEHILQEKREYENTIDSMMDKVRKQNYVTQEEKKIWLRNIEIMKPYMLQQKINRLYYQHVLENITKLIYIHKLSCFSLDFNLVNWHILRSISENLRQVSSELVFDIDNSNQLIIKLIIKFF